MRKNRGKAERERVKEEKGREKESTGIESCRGRWVA